MKKIILGCSCNELLSLSACSNGKSSQKDNRNLLTSPINKDVTTMGTYIKVTVYDKDKEAAVDKALKLPVEYNNLTTVNQSGSQIDEINQNAGIKPIKVDANVYELVKAGYNYSAKDLGYDITIGSLTSLWNIGMDNARKPAQSEIDQVLPLINYHDIKFDDKNETIYLTQKGARLDLAPLSKGLLP
ncbi:FAD:protein FMN transferase [Lactococcus lactis]|nr:FAD:protein FMN transferase [Lactococcus lactis]